MAKEIPDYEMSKIIVNLCKKSEPFKKYYTTEIPKLNGKSIRWIHDPALLSEGLAIYPIDKKNATREIKLKTHPNELMENGDSFLFAHEIGHLVDYEEGCPLIRLHLSIGQILTPYHGKIAALINSIMFDISVNLKLQKYGIEIPFICYKPPKKHKSPAYELTYIFRYVLFLCYGGLFNGRYKKEIQDCIESYNDKDLVQVGDDIFSIINRSENIDHDGNLKFEKVKSIIEEIFTHLKGFISRPSGFSITVRQYYCFIDISLTEIF
jgi:hypothetical protein